MRPPAQDAGMGNVDMVMFTARFETEQHKVLQKLCFERCTDTMKGSEVQAFGPGSHELLPEATRRCLDLCFHKFSDTAVLVSAESEAWQADQMMRSQAQTVAARAAIGAVATAAAVGLGCFLFRGGDE
mmetsp:Transcript_29799/g.47812  ORF Transcript_29799/g.47812 Transcript_29799/m.47812 type:complete len:128 (+) Transcript_29799:68-451(+)